MKPESNSASADDYDYVLSCLCSRDLTKRIEYLQRLWEQLCFVNWNQNAFLSMRYHCLKFIEIAKICGCESVSEITLRLMSYLDEIVASKQLPEDEQRYLIRQLLKNLGLNINEFNHSSGENTDLENETEKLDLHKQRDNKLIYIVDDDDYLSEFISIHITSEGYSVRTFSKPEEMLPVIEETVPSLVLMDVVFPDGGLTGIDAVNKVTTLTKNKTPVIFMSGRTDISARIDAIRAGGKGYFTKPVNIQNVIKKIDELVLVDNCPYKVLVVDDKTDISSHYINILEADGIIVKVVKKPLNVIKYIKSFTPDILLIDYDLKLCKGTELSTAIRQEQDLNCLPIIYMVDNVAASKKDIMLSQNGDDYVSKPLDDITLIETIKRNIIRARRISSNSGTVELFDPATDLTSRKKFISDVEVAVLSAVDRGPNSAIIWINFENIEEINQSIGPTYSNSVVKQITNTIFNDLTDKDLVSQLSESTFCILTSPREKEKTITLANLANKALNEIEVSYSDHHFKLKCNTGISFVLPGSHGSRSALAEAENACYHSEKSQGDNIVQFMGNVDEFQNDIVQSMEKTGITNWLQDRSFSLAFQPIICLGKSKRELYEVLIRMEDENKDILLPAEFLPLAAKEGLMHEVDRWVIEHAIRKLAENNNSRSNLFIKLDRDSFYDDSLIEWIGYCLKSAGIKEQQRIIFEISEKVILDNMEAVKKFSSTVTNYGCGIALDHFGVTNESLRILNDLPFEFVKIHSASINELSTDKELKEKYHSLIKSALVKCNDVIVGAIENPNTLSLVWGWGVRYIQGNFIQAPHKDLVFEFDKHRF